MKCGKCKKELKVLSKSFDVFDILNQDPNMMYCENNECKMFGIVTVAGIGE